MNLDRIKKYYIDNRLLCNCIMLAILFFVNCFVSGFCYLWMLALITLIITEDRKNGFSLLVFALPFMGIEANYVGFYCFVICFLVYLIKNYIVLFAIEKKKINWKVFIAGAIFVIFSLIHFGNLNIQFLIAFASIMMLFLTMNLFIRYTDIFNLKFNITILAIAIIVSCIYFLTYFISPIVGDVTIWEVGDFIRFPAFFNNPNVLAMVCEFCLAFLTFYLLQDKWEWTDIISYIIFGVVGLTTFSKTFLILFGIMFCILIVYILKRYKTKALWWVLGVLFVILAVCVIKYEFVFTYINRFFNGWHSDLDDYEQVVDIVTTGRYKLWTTVLEYLFTHPLVLFFGRGLGAPLVASMSAHNFYISLLYQMGIVGGIIFVGMFVVLILEYFKQNPHKMSKAIIVPVVIIGLLMCVEDLFLYIY